MYYEHVLSVQLKDGVVAQDDEVWVHWADVPPEKDLAKYHWKDIVEDPLWFSIEKPEYTISKDGATVYTK